MVDLLINGKDAYASWGIRMDIGFLDVLFAPASMKEYIENESRLENGKRVFTGNAKLDSREVTLSFTLTGKSQEDYRTKKKAFYDELYKGAMTIEVPADSTDVYNLVYLGKSISYAQNTARTFGKLSIKFLEPNPANRS